MKLLSKVSAESDIKFQNEELIGTNIRLRKYWQEITSKLNTIRDSYDPDKLKVLKDFEDFVKDFQLKKSKLLEELQGIENEISKKKELYYSLISKQDLLDERIHEIREQEKKLDLREKFVFELENKWNEKNANL